MHWFPSRGFFTGVAATTLLHCGGEVIETAAPGGPLDIGAADADAAGDDERSADAGSGDLEPPDATSPAPNTWSSGKNSWSGSVACENIGGFFVVHGESSTTPASRVSLTFAKRPTASTAYLVADATDNIADSEVVMLLSTVGAADVLGYRATSGSVQVTLTGGKLRASAVLVPATLSLGEGPPGETLGAALACP